MAYRVESPSGPGGDLPPQAGTGVGWWTKTNPWEAVQESGKGTGTGSKSWFSGEKKVPISTFDVGAKGGGQFQGGGGVQLPWGGGTGIDFGAVQAALDKQKGEVNSIFGQQLGIGSGQFGVLGSVLQNMLTNPQGMNPKDMALARTRISEREAGVRGTALERMGVSQLGPRVADAALRESIRGQSGARITDAELALDFQNQQMMQQNLLAALQAALGTAGISAGLAGQHGNITAQMFNPIAAGMGGGGNQSGPGSKLLPNERGLSENRLPGEALADQLRREAAAWQAYFGGAKGPHQ